MVFQVFSVYSDVQVFTNTNLNILCSQVFNMNCACAGRFISTMVHCLCDPCYESVTIMFTKIYVTTIQGTEGYKNLDPGMVRVGLKSGVEFEGASRKNQD